MAVFAKSLEARCQVENEDVFGAAPTADAPTTSEWTTILLPTKVRLILVDFLIGHYTYRIFPPAIDIIPTLLAVVYSNGKYTN